MKVRITDCGEVIIWCRNLEEAEELYNCGQVETDKYVKFEEIVEEVGTNDQRGTTTDSQADTV